jgi:hypothetical protein
MPENMREVKLSSELCRNAELRFGSRFGTIDEMLTFVLQELLRDDAAQMDRAEQRIIEERLKDLGYI